MTRGLGGRSPANVTHHLAGMDFPASKDDLIRRARETQAPPEVLEELQAFPDDEFGSMADVMAAYGDANEEISSGDRSEDRRTH
ncbi:MAG: DUF2795 domain-containing protein [Alphaproteobacteria bacterium]